MQRGEQHVAGSVAGEHPAGAVRAVRCRCEPNHQHPGPDRPPTRYRAAPVGLFGKRFPLLAATCSRQSTSRGQARQTVTAASSSARDFARSAKAATCSGVEATGVPAVAGSSGQPEPGCTGEPNSVPSLGWGKRTGPLCTAEKSLVDPDGPLLDSA